MYKVYICTMQDRNYRRVGQGDYEINFGAQFLALKMKQKISRNLKKKIVY